ncbi:APC family permease [Ureibacillus composti]|nr:APC family permease [Ureibacillus composti]
MNTKVEKNIFGHTSVLEREATPVEKSNTSALKGNMGVGELVMSVLAFSAPLVTASGFIPVLLIYSGSSAPFIYLFCTIILVLFTIGFTKMGLVMERPGGFYSFITAGLGRNVGLTSAILATIGYILIGLCLAPFLAILVSSFLTSTFNLPELPWYVIAIPFCLLTTYFAYQKVDLSAKVLFFVMVLECIIVAGFNIASFVIGGTTGEITSISLPAVSSGTFGVAMLFALANFLGFEATVIFREECKNPKRTIPLATFIAVIGIGLFYALTAWAFVAYFGGDNIAEVAAGGTADLLLVAVGELTTKVIVDCILIVAMTSAFASMLAIQNVASRYLYSLGVDGALPKALGKVHQKHYSPYVAAFTVGIVWVALLVVFAISGQEVEYLYPLFAGSGTFMITIILFVTSIAIIFYFKKNKQADMSKWSTLVAPILGMIGLLFIFYMAITNFGELLGSTGAVTAAFFIGILVIISASYVYSKIIQKKKPDIYERIGRQNPENL